MSDNQENNPQVAVKFNFGKAKVAAPASPVTASPVAELRAFVDAAPTAHASPTAPLAPPAHQRPTISTTFLSSITADLLCPSGEASVIDWITAVRDEQTRNSHWSRIIASFASHPQSADDPNALTVITCRETGQPIGITSSADADPSLTTHGLAPSLVVKSTRNLELLRDTAPIAAMSYQLGRMLTALITRDNATNAQRASNSPDAIRYRQEATYRELSLAHEYRQRFYARLSDEVTGLLSGDAGTPDTHANAYAIYLAITQFAEHYNTRLILNQLASVQRDAITTMISSFLAGEYSIHQLATQLPYALTGLTMKAGRDAIEAATITFTRARLTRGFFYYNGELDGSHPSTSADWEQGFRQAAALNVKQVIALPAAERARLARETLSNELRMKAVSISSATGLASTPAPRKKSERTTRIEQAAATLFDGLDISFK